MVSVSTLLLLTGGLAAHTSAKLWGWPDDYAVVRQSKWHKGIWLSKAQVCEPWGNWCDQSRCQDLEQLQVAPGGLESIMPENWSWANMRKGGSAWVDAWRGDGDTFTLYEQNGDGSAQGQCQVADEFKHWTETECGGGVRVVPYMHCWQW